MYTFSVIKEDSVLIVYGTKGMIAGLRNNKSIILTNHEVIYIEVCQAPV